MKKIHSRRELQDHPCGRAESALAENIRSVVAMAVAISWFSHVCKVLPDNFGSFFRLRFMVSRKHFRYQGRALKNIFPIFVDFDHAHRLVPFSSRCRRMIHTHSGTLVVQHLSAVKGPNVWGRECLI